MLQEDWDQTNQTAATVLIQLAAPKQFIHQFTELKQDAMNFKYTEEEKQVFGMNSLKKKSNHINLKDFLGKGSQFKLNQSEDS